MARMGFQTLQEIGIKKEKEKGEINLTYSSRNRLLTKAYEVYRTMRDNELRQNQIEVSEEDRELVKKIQNSIYMEIEKNWYKEQTVDEMQRAIDEALKNTYDDILREGSTNETETKKLHTRQHVARNQK